MYLELHVSIYKTKHSICNFLNGHKYEWAYENKYLILSYESMSKFMYELRQNTPAKIIENLNSQEEAQLTKFFHLDQELAYTEFLQLHQEPTTRSLSSSLHNDFHISLPCYRQWFSIIQSTRFLWFGNDRSIQLEIFRIQTMLYSILLHA
jgi:hypothetical protein